MDAREKRYRARKRGIVRPPSAAPDAVMRVLRVPPELAGMRLDRFVASELRATSRTRSQLIIAHSAYSPEGARLKKNHRVQAWERVVLWRPPWDEEACDVELPILFEDDQLVAVDKPPLVAVHPTARHHRSTVTVMLAERRPELAVTLVHRLDRETSGVLLLARTRAADRAVKLQLEARRNVLKRYLVLCWGWPEWERHTCELALGRDEESPYRVRMGVRPGGLESATTFEVLERRRRQERQYCLIRATLHTGRQHQIRVHASACGLPVVGDKLYGPDPDMFARGADGELTDDDLRRLELPRQALHHTELELTHPSGDERLSLKSPLPADMRAFWDALEPA